MHQQTQVSDRRFDLGDRLSPNGAMPEPGAESKKGDATLLESPQWKRALDITLIVLSFPIWLPLMILLVLLIKIVSPGPVFFRQERVGYRGRSFMILKFRSMKVNAETTHHEHY